MAVFEMGPLKAPGPDGLQPIFSHSQWDIIGSSICNLVHHIYSEPEVVRGLNETLVVLIPKNLNPESWKNYRPISLCNVIFKIVTKIIATRLRRHMSSLVAPHQCSFISGRHSSDNVVIAQEVFHSMRCKKGKKGFVVVKVDLEKAYDRLWWEFLDDTLAKIGFNDHFKHLIKCCVSTVSMSILFNGSRTEYFKPTRGIRQGDPLSPLPVCSLCWEASALY